MANQTPLASWLYSKREELNPRFREFNWPKQWLAGLFDFSTTITWDGTTVEGRGVDEKREIALEKSVAEALERLICIKIGIDSVGLAVAGTHDPSTHAQNEALERFYLKEHIRNQIPFQIINGQCSIAHEFRKAHPASAVTFYRMETSPDLFGVVCLVTSPEAKKSSLGFALSKSLEESMRRALLEALPSFVWLVDGTIKSEAAGSSLPWHIAPEFLDQILPLLNGTLLMKAEGTIKTPELLKIDVRVSEISVLTSAPMRAARFVVPSDEVSV